MWMQRLKLLDKERNLLAVRGFFVLPKWRSSRSNEFLKIHLYPRWVQPNTDVLQAKKGGETDEHCKIFYFSGFGRCVAWRFCLCEKGDSSAASAATDHRLLQIRSRP
jgi:hypothetical protein